MQFTFEYEVDQGTRSSEIISVSFKEELTDEQTERLIASYKTGNFNYLDEDDSISDIYFMVEDIATQIEEQDEDYGALVGTEVKVTNFSYPEELKDLEKAQKP